MFAIVPNVHIEVVQVAAFAFMLAKLWPHRQGAISIEIAG